MIAHFAPSALTYGILGCSRWPIPDGSPELPHLMTSNSSCPQGHTHTDDAGWASGTNLTRTGDT